MYNIWRKTHHPLISTYCYKFEFAIIKIQISTTEFKTFILQYFIRISFNKGYASAIKFSPIVYVLNFTNFWTRTHVNMISTRKFFLIIDRRGEKTNILRSRENSIVNNVKLYVRISYNSSFVKYFPTRNSTCLYSIKILISSNLKLFFSVFEFLLQFFPSSIDHATW